MSKTSFLKEIADYKKEGGQMAFVFGELHFPVDYHSALGTLSVTMPEGDVSVVVDYNSDLGTNCDRLMEALLDRYPKLEEA
ncbi:MAG: hypothetical protein ACOYJF_04600 [Prevotella sp.]|jgi:hypothetical protein